MAYFWWLSGKAWTRLSGQNGPGRPGKDREIRKVATSNPLRGAPRAHGELLTPGIDQGHGKVAGLPELRDGIAVRRIHIKNVVTLMHAEKTRITRCDNNRGLSRVRQAGWARAARRGRPTASDIVRMPRENAPGGAAGMAGLPGVRFPAASARCRWSAKRSSAPSRTGPSCLIRAYPRPNAFKLQDRSNIGRSTASCFLGLCRRHGWRSVLSSGLHGVPGSRRARPGCRPAKFRYCSQP